MIKELFSKEYQKYTVTTIILFLLSITIGTLLHFTFDWTGENLIVGIISPVNESIWEHLKLLYFPFIYATVAEYFVYGKDVHCFFTAKLSGLTLGLLFMITNYYTVIGAFGVNNMAVNIGIFISAFLVAFGFSFYRMLKPMRFSGGAFEIAALSIMAAYLLAFVIFTYYPPHIPLFRDPMTMNYSISK